MDRRKFIKSAGLTIPITGLLPAVALDFIGSDRMPIPMQDKHLIKQGKKS